MSDQPVNLTATIPPGYALQDYLCSGPLKPNNYTTIVLEGGEHRISSGQPCKISNEGDITITGFSMKNTTVRCEEGTVFVFISVQELTIVGLTFVNCRINLVSVENILISECTFENIFSGLSTDTGGSAVYIYNSTGNISITCCTFQNNSAPFGGGVYLWASTGDVSITRCTFQNNSALYGGGVSLKESMCNVSITSCTFQNNRALYGGGGVYLLASTGDVSIIDCTFQNNNGSNGGGVLLWRSIGNVSITSSTFQDCHNVISVTIGGGKLHGGGGAVFFGMNSIGDFTIVNCTFQSNGVTNGWWWRCGIPRVWISR